MRIKIRSGLLPLNLLVIVLAAVIILFPSNILRIVLGFPFVLFFPGYALMVALFPRKVSMSGIERVALSFGLSIAVVPLIGLILYYTPLGIRLESILYSLASFIFIMSVIAWLRRRQLLESEQFSIEFHLVLPSWGGSAEDKVLSIILALAILGALGMIGYVIAAPRVGQGFTEFGILGLEGKLEGYPTALMVGEEGKVKVCIVNHEHETVSYYVKVRIDGVKNNEIEPIVLEHDEKWEGEVAFTPQVAGKDRKVEFLLYKNWEDEPYLEPLRLWIDVTE